MAKIDLTKPGGARRIIVRCQDDIEKKRRELGLTVMRQISAISPVHTGRLREGWMPSLNTPSDFLPDEGKYALPDIPGRAAQAWSSSKITDVFYIVNNVPYAVMVNNGTVKMSPRRFVERAITKVAHADG